jgi:hypothetical protein
MGHITDAELVAMPNDCSSSLIIPIKMRKARGEHNASGVAQKPEVGGLSD